MGQLKESKAELKIVTVQNPFDRRERDVAVIDLQGRTVAELVALRVPAGLPVTVSLNGEIILPERQTSLVPRQGDTIVIVPTVQGGDTGKMILRVVITIVATIVGAVAGQYWLGPYVGATLGAAIGGAIGSVAGGLIANAIIPQAAPKLGGMETAQISNSYAWNPVTTQQQGIVIARTYGKMKVHGNITAAFLENGTNTKGDAISYVNALLGIGYGPYKSLTEFTINDQPLSGSAAAPGLKGIEIHSRLGYLAQQVVPNFNDTKTERTLSVKITKAAPYVYLTPGNNFDQLEVEVTFPRGLYYANDQGGLTKIEVQFKIEIAPELSTVWVPIAKQTRNAPTVSAYERWSAGYWSGGYYPETDGGGNPTGRNIGSEPVWIEITAGSLVRSDHSDGDDAGSDGNFDGGIRYIWRWIGTYGEHIGLVPQNDYIAASDKTAPFRLTFKSGTITQKGKYQIRVSRLTNEWNDTRHGEDLYLTSVREVVYDKFTYPRMALVGIRALATDQLSGSFAFSCMVEGALIRVYDGVSWTVQYSTNPAWVCFDVLTQPVFNDNLTVSRYDGIDPSRLDIPKFLEWAQFCATLVPDGKGGQEARVTFNGIFDAEMTMWEAALQVCRVGRATLLWNGINISVAIDQAATPVQLFTVGNIERDSFKVDYLSLSERSSEIEADFVNAEKGYERDRLSVIDTGLQNKSSKVATNLFGLTKPSEVWRHLQYQLNCNKYLTRTAQFQADIDAIVCTIGDVINVQHDVPRWGDAGGRLVAATANSVTLDKEVTIATGTTYGFMVKVGKTDHLIERIITNAAGPATVLTFATPLTEIPEQYDVYAFGVTTKVTKPFRVILIEPTSELRATITGIEYNASIYGSDTGLPVIPTQNYSAEPAFKSVLSLAAVERIEDRPDGTVADLIFVSWTRPVSNRVKEFEVWVDYGTGYEYVRTTAESSVSFPASKTGVVGVRVRTVNRDGLKQPLVEAPSVTITVYGSLMTVPNVTGLALDGYAPNATEFTGKDIPLRWNYVSQRSTGLTEPAGPGRASAWFRYYVIEVYDGVVLRRTDYRVQETYLYTYEMNRQDGVGIAKRALTFRVRVMSSWGAMSATPAAITVSNPNVPALTTLALTGAVNLLSVGLPGVTDPDFKGYLVHASQTPNFIPDASNQINSGGPETVVTKVNISAGVWYVKAAAYDTFGTDGANYSAQYQVTVNSLTIVPEMLDAAQRVDFFVRDTIFTFTGTTLNWTAGYIDRGTKTYTLAAGSLLTANAKFIVATLTDGTPNTAALTASAVGAGLPALTSNQVLIAVTSATANTIGNYYCFVRQPNSMSIEGALIRDATITDAKITGVLAANKITTLDGTVTLTGGSVTLSNLGTTATWTGVTGAGKPADNATVGAIWGTNLSSVPARFGDAPAGAGLSITATNLGYYNGTAWKTYMDNAGNFYLSGSGTHSLSWNGATLNIRGSLNADDITAGTLTGRTLQTGTTGTRFVVSSTDGQAHFFGDRGDTVVEELATIGITTIGTNYIIGSFGTANSNKVAVYGRALNAACGYFETSGTSAFAYGVDALAVGVYGVRGTSSNAVGYGVCGIANSGIAGVIGYSSGGAGVRGEGGVSDFHAAGCGVMRLAPRTSFPTTPVAGMFIYNDITGNGGRGWICFFNGTNWYTTNGVLVG